MLTDLKGQGMEGSGHRGAGRVRAGGWRLRESGEEGKRGLATAADRRCAVAGVWHGFRRHGQWRGKGREWGGTGRERAVLSTSIGVTSSAAKMPDRAPETKAVARVLPLRAGAALSRRVQASYDHQYRALKGTSRPSVGTRPRNLGKGG